jgi:hypothetical protein
MVEQGKFRIRLAVPLTAALFAGMATAQFYPEPPCGPSTKPNPAYPLHVHIFGVHFLGQGNWGYQGYGRANLLGPNPVGLDYTFQCGRRPMYNAQADDYYQARWKKPDQQLEMLMQDIGKNKVVRCNVNVVEKPGPYKLGEPETVQ